MAKTKKRLGRGLGSLISGGVGSPADKAAATEVGQAGGIKRRGRKPTVASGRRSAAARGDKARSESTMPPAEGYFEIPIDAVDASPYQPRREINPDQLAELAESISSEGLLQPVVVRRNGERFQLVAGERRMRACTQIGLKMIPARVIDASDASSAVMSLIENLQREGLNPIEEALGFASLMRDFDLTQESVAERVGKGRATVANALRLLQLGREIQGFLSKGLLSVGHAKVILGIEDAEQRMVLARRIIESGLSVRDLERIARAVRGGNSVRSVRRRPSADAAALQAIEKELASHLNTRVQIKHSPKKGRITIEYFGNDDLHRILERLGVQT